MKAVPRASRSGTVAHKDDVDVSLRSIDSPLPNVANYFCTLNYKSVCAGGLGKKLTLPNSELFAFPLLIRSNISPL
jgi:hypothetical protein